MKTLLYIKKIVLCSVALCCFQFTFSQREIIPLDSNWKFHLGNGYDINRDFNFGNSNRLQFAKLEPQGYGSHSIDATTLDFDDYHWQNVTVPHDWVPSLSLDDSQPAAMGKRYGYHRADKRFPESHIGWYRKTLRIQKKDAQKIITLCFDGVFRNAMVWVNGFYMGRHWSGYTGFSFDISEYVRFGKKNVISVRVDASLHEGWFYEGAGINKEVWLIKTNPLHIANEGPYITSKINDTATRAEVSIVTEVKTKNNSAKDVHISVIILDENEKNIGQSDSKNKSLKKYEPVVFKNKISIQNPKLWSVDSPYLYTALVLLKKGSVVVDNFRTQIGIRKVTFDAQKGFLLNDKKLFIKGVCIHQNFVGVGAGIPKAMHIYRLQLLKEMGVNAIRSHYPFSKSTLKVCDSLGMMVMDETRSSGSTSEALGQLRWMITNHRNHPSVIIWSMANEEGGTQRNIIGKRYMKQMVDLSHYLDPSRKVTAGVNAWGNNVDFGFSQEIDVMGFNYSLKFIEPYHKTHPNQPIIGTEVGNTFSCREYYPSLKKPEDIDTENGVGGYYDPNHILKRKVKPRGAYYHDTAEANKNAYESLQFYKKYPYLAGSFIWTGFDYKGESLRAYPNIGSQFGAMDAAGFPKSIYYYYQSWWTKKNVLHIAQHWNWKGCGSKKIKVLVHSNAGEVALFLNNKMISKKKMQRYEYLVWEVPYEPGTLKAIGYKNKKEVSRYQISTVGQPHTILLEPNKKNIYSNGKDMIVVKIHILDKMGRKIPLGNTSITLVTSKGFEIVGVGNGDPTNTQSERSNHIKLYNGKALVILRSKNKTMKKVLLKAACAKLKTAILSIENLK